MNLVLKIEIKKIYFCNCSLTYFCLALVLLLQKMQNYWRSFFLDRNPITKFLDWQQGNYPFYGISTKYPKFIFPKFISPKSWPLNTITNWNFNRDRYPKIFYS